MANSFSVSDDATTAEVNDGVTRLIYSGWPNPEGDQRIPTDIAAWYLGTLRQIVRDALEYANRSFRAAELLGPCASQGIRGIRLALHLLDYEPHPDDALEAIYRRPYYMGKRILTFNESSEVSA